MPEITIFRTGQHQSHCGQRIVVTPSDLDRVVDNYNPQDPAPLVIGHPSNDAPAHGWVAGLRRVGDTLVASVVQLSSTLRSANRQGQYRRVSAKFSLHKGVINRLIHIGMLGACRPAVASLPPVAFAAFSLPFVPSSMSELEQTDNPSSDDSMAPTLAEREQNLKIKELAFARHENQLRQRLIDDFLAGQVQSGRIFPKDTAILAEVMQRLEPAFAFSESDQSATTRPELSARFRQFLSELPIRTPVNANETTIGFSQSDNPAALASAIHDRVSQAKKNGIDLSYSAALQQVLHFQHS